MVLTKPDLAKYPFVQEAAEEVKALELMIDSLENPNLERVLDRAEKRIEEALQSNPPKVSYRPREEGIEIPSYPVAVMLAAATGNNYVKRRYALAESIRAHQLLEKEDKKKVLEVAEGFNCNIRMIGRIVGYRYYDFALHFTDFLRNTKAFHESEWKLVNRFVINGEVYLTKKDVARLLQEEVIQHIQKKMEISFLSKSEVILLRIEKIKSRYSSYQKKARTIAFPKHVVNQAFSPCISKLHRAASSGLHISHLGRFTLTSFLVNIGMKNDGVINLFRSSSDFNERMTRYQVEHIAGDRGSKTKYKPPTCETLKTHGLCPGADDLCRRVRRPLDYYRWKTRTLKKESFAN